MENRKFMIIMATLGFIIIGSCVLGICSYNEMYKMDVNAQMQTYITGITGPDLAKQKAKQKAEDEAELQRIKDERKLALDEELKKSLEREKATKERYEAMNKEYETNNDRQSYSSEENRSSQDTNPYLKYMEELLEHTNEYRSGAWRGNPMELVFVQRAILQDYDNLINLASSLGDQRRYDGFMRAKEVQMAQFRAASY